MIIRLAGEDRQQGGVLGAMFEARKRVGRDTRIGAIAALRPDQEQQIRQFAARQTGRT